MRFRSAGNERGAVTAELAIGIPALVGVVAITLGAMRWGTDAATATTLAAESSLAIERGQPIDSVLNAARIRLPRAQWSAIDSCVRAILPPTIPLAQSITVEQCASM